MWFLSAKVSFFITYCTVLLAKRKFNFWVQNLKIQNKVKLRKWQIFALKFHNSFNACLPEIKLCTIKNPINILKTTHECLQVERISFITERFIFTGNVCIRKWKWQQKSKKKYAFFIKFIKLLNNYFLTIPGISFIWRTWRLIHSIRRTIRHLTYFNR